MNKRKRTIPTRRKSPWGRGWELVHGEFFWQRIAICIAAAMVLFLFTRGWEPSFPYRIGDVPSRDLYARVDFAFPDYKATDDKREAAREGVLCYYEHSPRRLEEVREALADRLFRITGADNLESLDPAIIHEFIPVEKVTVDDVTDEMRREVFEQLQTTLAEDADGAKVRRAVEHAMLDHHKKGLLNNLAHDLEDGSTQQIQVYVNDDLESAVPVDVSDVRFSEVSDTLRSKVELELGKEFDDEQQAAMLAEHVFNWLFERLPVTLIWNEELTQRERDVAAALVELQEKQYRAGQRLEPPRSGEFNARGIAAGIALTEDDLTLLRAEHHAFLFSRGWLDVATYILASLGMYSAVFGLCGFYLYYRDPGVLAELKQLIPVVATAAVTVCLMWLLSAWLGWWQGELIPLVIFTMTISIAYQQELGFFLTAIVSFLATMTSTQGLPDFVIMIATSSAAALLCGTIRSRTRLVYVGIIAAAIGFPTAIGVHILDGTPLGAALLTRAAWVALSAVIAGLLMTALLPFLEKTLNLETDISLLEIGDAAHPLLQELVRRAPGTYNHSINVASIAEAAADAIGANGLLCRVGAYFHDIGKMLKPEYFIENQGSQGNKHESLVPAMSTLVITAHVKDGVELAREHHLPTRIIDLIEQHHGTTLIEYFYLRATRMSEESTDQTTVDESSYRYPGPKPQTREAAVMMLADAVESASRTLVDPAPARITSLVHEISRKRLDDGQFDECSLTLRQIKRIEESLIKSLTAVYHGRVKYPDQQTA